MLKIGGVNIDISHPLAFSERMEDNCMDMKYEYVFNEGFREDEEVNWFIKRFNLAGRVDKIEDMVDKVDIGFVQACNWEKHVKHAMPFIEKGKPVFIEKPMAGSVKDIKKIRELVKNGAVIYGSSSIRYSTEIKDFLAKPIEERGEILSIYGTSGQNEFDYTIHIVETISQLAQSKIVSNKFLGRVTGPDGENCETFHILFENGIRATYCTLMGKGRPFNLTIMTTKGLHSFTINAGNAYTELLKNIYKQITTGKSDFVDVDTILNCCEAMICGKKSRDDLNGAEVKITELTDDDKFDGYAFEEGYAAKAKVIYKDK